MNRIAKMPPFGVAVDPLRIHKAPKLRQELGQAGRRCRVNFGSRSTYQTKLITQRQLNPEVLTPVRPIWFPQCSADKALPPELSQHSKQSLSHRHLHVY